MNGDEKSRTRIKNEDRALQKVGEQLVGLSNERLADMDMPDELREAIGLARKTTSHGARRRQVKYIGALLRQVDTTPIRDALDEIRHGEHQKALAFKKIEKWRDELRAGNMGLVDEIVASCPGANRQRLAQLARNAKKEFAANRGVKSSRALFRYLKEIAD